MTKPRFAVTTGGPYRLARWFGRGLSVASAWPIYYALFGKTHFDWESIMFGAPTLVGGLVLWRWAGYRLRNPRDYLEIDREAGVARLVREHAAAPIECRLDALGDWSFEGFATSHVHKGTKTTTHWNGVRCPGFGPHRLFVAEEADACRRWCAQVDAAARSYEPPGWDWSGVDVEPVLARYGLGDRNALLWTATGLARKGSRTLDAATLDAAARSMTHTTVAVRVAERLDDATSSMAGLAGAFLVAGTALFAAVALRPLMDHDGTLLELGVLAAIGLAVVCLGWRAVGRPVVAATIAGLAGAAYVGKPWYAPVLRELDGALVALSPTSETHLYSVIPGVLLLVLAVVMLTSIEIRKPATASSTRADRIELEPPRPEPPQPPSPG